MRSRASESKSSQLEGVEETWSGIREDLFDGGLDGLAQDGLVNLPKPFEEFIHPVGRLCGVDKPLLHELALNVFPCSSAEPLDAVGVVSRAKGEDDEHPTQAQTEECREVGGKDCEHDDSCVVVPVSVVHIVEPCLDEVLLCLDGGRSWVVDATHLAPSDLGIGEPVWDFTDGFGGH